MANTPMNPMTMSFNNGMNMMGFPAEMNNMNGNINYLNNENNIIEQINAPDSISVINANSNNYEMPSVQEGSFMSQNNIDMPDVTNNNNMPPPPSSLPLINPQSRQSSFSCTSENNNIDMLFSM